MYTVRAYVEWVDRARTVSGLFACMYVCMYVCMEELCMCVVFCTYSVLHGKSR